MYRLQWTAHFKNTAAGTIYSSNWKTHNPLMIDSSFGVTALSLIKELTSASPVSVFIFNPFFNHFYCPTRPTVPTLSLCLPMLPYMISMISTFFPTMWTPTLISLSLSSQPFTRYQEQGLLVVDFGLLRAISMISTIPMISLPIPELLHNLSQCSLQPHEHLTNSLEIANSLLQHLNLRSYW